MRLLLPPLLLVRLHRLKLLLLGIVQDCFDLAVAVVAQTVHLRHPVLLTH